jgi:hypothetical protein
MTTTGEREASGSDQSALTSAPVMPERDRRIRLGSWVRTEYERLHPGDSFEDLKRRARFSKEDKGLLREWLEVAEGHDRAAQAYPLPGGLRRRPAED